MDNIYVYTVSLPANINEMVTPCLDGYTIYIDETLSPEGKFKAYNHAMQHINNGDFEKQCSVDIIEVFAHG